MRAGTIVLILLVAVALMSLGLRVTHQRDAEANTRSNEAVPLQEQDIPTIRLDILNATTVDGLAGQVATAVGRVGAIAGHLGNTEKSDRQQSMLVNRRLSPEIADHLAGKLGNLPVVFEFDVRAQADAVLILGADHVHVLENLGLRPR